MRHEQHVTNRRLTFRFPNRLVVEARPDVFDQPIQSFRHVRRRFSPGASVPPYIPHLLPGLFPLLFDLRARLAFVVPVVPFPYVSCDLHFCFCAYVAGSLGVGVGVLPGEFVPAADVEEFEGATGASAGGYVAGGAQMVSVGL